MPSPPPLVCANRSCEVFACMFVHSTTQSRKNAEDDAPGHRGMARRDMRRIQAHGYGVSTAEQCSARVLTLLLAALLARCVV